jgi:hypothetical protein
MGMEITGPDKIQSLQDTLISLKGVQGEEKAQGIHFMPQHEGFWVK